MVKVWLGLDAKTTAEMGFLCKVAGLTLRVRSSDVLREQGSRATAPLRRKKPAELVRASDQDASGVSWFSEHAQLVGGPSTR